MELKKYRLGDIAKVEISGIDQKSKEGQQDVLLCNFVDVYYNWAVTKDNESKFMPATASDSEIESFTLHKGQVAITKDSETRDDIGVATYIADDFDNLVVLGYHTALITPDEEQLCGKYLNALMHSSYFQRYWSNNASGSGQRYTLSQKVIEDAPVYLPDIDIQREIGEFFSDLDRKICLNKKENETLEAMAKQLYDYWFVQFDFPDSNGRPYKTTGGKMVWNETLKREIPEGWEDKRISECIHPFERGISYSSDDIKKGIGTPMINLACFDKQGNYRTGELKYFFGEYDSEFLVYPDDMLIATTDMTRNADIIGTPIWVNREHESFLFTTDLVRLVPKDDVQPSFIYFTLKDKSYHKYIKPFASGTNVMHLNVQGIMDYKFAYAPHKIQESFENHYKAIKKRQDQCINEMNSLKELKGFILPLLMTGQVTIG